MLLRIRINFTSFFWSGWRVNQEGDVGDAAFWCCTHTHPRTAGNGTRQEEPEKRHLTGSASVLSTAASVRQVHGGRPRTGGDSKTDVVDFVVSFMDEIFNEIMFFMILVFLKSRKYIRAVHFDLNEFQFQLFCLMLRCEVFIRKVFVTYRISFCACTKW